MAAVTAFTGTATGRTYEVGKIYVTGAGVRKVALPNGKFAPVDAGAKASVTKGSSESQNVTFIVSDNNNKKYSVKGASLGAPSSRVASALVSELADEPRYSGTGAGKKGYASGSAGVGGGAGTPSGWLDFVVPDYPYSVEPMTIKIEDRKEGITIPMVFGIPIVPLPWETTDAGDLEQALGESEFGSVTYFANQATALARFGYSAGLATGKAVGGGLALLQNNTDNWGKSTRELASMGLGVNTPQEYETYSPDFGGSLMFPTNAN